jgi:hypothetical protein
LDFLFRHSPSYQNLKQTQKSPSPSDKILNLNSLLALKMAETENKVPEDVTGGDEVGQERPQDDVDEGDLKKPEHEDRTAREGSVQVDSQPKTKPFIILIACCAALGGLIFGYDIGGAGATFVMDGECSPA